MSLYQLVYLSQRAAYCDEAALDQLLKQSITNNKANDITGILMRCDTHFFQYIEGEQNVVLALYQKIKADPRHSELVTVSSGVIERRAFANWEMRSELLTPAAIQSLLMDKPVIFSCCGKYGVSLIRLVSAEKAITDPFWGIASSGEDFSAMADY
jgi:ABC-type uncharacterized transport system YnjBCD ATPase subunit